MSGTYIPVEVGGVEVLVEATEVRLPGSEPTAVRPGQLAGHVRDAFGQAQSAIVEIAAATATALRQAGRAARPDAMEVEFGVKFSAKGDIIVAGASGEVTLKVKLTYDGRGAAQPAGDDGEADGEAS
ncbi:CU044_2847 family protein [Streptomyces diastatochromogenes]|uniref:CU044_2847 family protein n=1 Tax=Streptomyces diastatochromogenes TaxID=42236 RepID=UPI003689E273